MKRIQTMIVVAILILGARAACADDLVSTDNGMTVTDVVTTPKYGTVIIKWLADANFAASLTPDSPYWVPGINADGSMSLGTATAFIAQLNNKAYLGITTWRLPTTDIHDTSCSFKSAGGNFGYGCGRDFSKNPGYPFSELAGLFYNGLGGTAHNNIWMVHNSSIYLFKHLQPYLYWSETAQYNNVKFGNDFWFQNGFQGTEDEYDSMFVLPVSTAATIWPPAKDIAPACAATIPNTCPPDDLLLPGLGLTTELPPPGRPTLQRSLDGQLVYDPVLNVAFLANANLARTLSPDSPYYVSGINPDGSMNQATLTNFLAALNNPAHPYLGITGWTLPEIAVDGDNPNCTINPMNGSPVYGYNCDGTASQLGELFYDQLGGEAGQDIRWTSNWGLLLFNHLESDYYWQCHPTTTPGQCAPGPGKEIPSLSFRSGYQGLQSDVNELFVMLVVPADSIPEENP
jgi:hypothetical protein